MQYGRPRTKGETFFFTIATRNRAFFLCERSSVLSMRDALRTVSSHHPFSLNAFVLLPDHLHCIWTLPTDDRDFADRWSEIKSQFSKGIGISPGAPVSSPEREGPDELWRPGLGEHQILDDRDFISHVEYIHYNPVKHGLVSQPRAWPHSTFLRYVERGLYLPEWGSPGEVLFDSGIESE
jgi:putative transposase